MCLHAFLRYENSRCIAGTIEIENCNNPYKPPCDVRLTNDALRTTIPLPQTHRCDWKCSYQKGQQVFQFAPDMMPRFVAGNRPQIQGAPPVPQNQGVPPVPHPGSNEGAMVSTTRVERWDCAHC